MLPPPRPRYDTLDAWRGVACLAVILFHSVAAILPPGEFAHRVMAEGGSVADWVLVGFGRFWAGVPVFFVVSGYCIAAAADAARRRPRPALSFFTRRLRRIYPPLWVFLAVGAVAVAALPPLLAACGVPVVIPFRPPTDVPAVQWLGSLTLTEEWRHHLGGPEKGYFIGHIWTLCYEEQFYLVAGLILLFARRWLFPALGVVTVAVAGLVTGVIPCPFPTDGFFFDGLWLAFAAGVGVYYRANYATPVVRRCIDAAQVVGTVWAVARVGDWAAFSPSLPAHLTVAFPTALALGLLHRFDVRTARWPLLAPLRWCGRRCYSLYLVHGPIAVSLSLTLYTAGVTNTAAVLLIVVPACVTASLAAGAVFYRWVESRFLNQVSRAETAPAQLATAGAAC